MSAHKVESKALFSLQGSTPHKVRWWTQRNATVDSRHVRNIVIIRPDPRLWSEVVNRHTCRVIYGLWRSSYGAFSICLWFAWSEIIDPRAVVMSRCEDAKVWRQTMQLNDLINSSLTDLCTDAWRSTRQAADNEMRAKMGNRWTRLFARILTIVDFL